MLLHLRPRFFKFAPGDVALVDMRLEPFGLHLRGGVDLVTRRPYPNKRFQVACRKQGHKAIDGILVQTPGPVKEFRYTARWSIDAEMLVTHHVNYRLLDQDFDTASDSTSFWYATSESLGGWSSRWPEGWNFFDRSEPDPWMSLRHDPEDAAVTDRLDDSGHVVERCQTFSMPTIERDRLNSEIGPGGQQRMPSLEMAFQVGS